MHSYRKLDEVQSKYIGDHFPYKLSLLLEQWKGAFHVELLFNKPMKMPVQVFWEMYALKKGNVSRAVHLWSKLGLEEQRDMLRFLTAYNPVPTKPYPETFLNQRRWENEDELSNYAPKQEQKKISYTSPLMKKG